MNSRFRVFSHFNACCRFAPGTNTIRFAGANMTNPSLEERVHQLERALADAQSKLAQVDQRPPTFPPRKIAADDPYWEEREQELAKINFEGPIDSTAIVSEDRDRT